MPLKNQLHVDQLLSQVSVKYANAEYVAKRAFPIVNVMKDSDLYRVYEANFRLPETNVADGGVAREHNFDISTASYNLEKHALKDFISDDAQDNYDQGDLRADTVEELTEVIDRRLEYSFTQLFTKTSWSLTHSLASGLEWTNQTTTANPIQDADTAASVALINSGYKVNYCILGRDGFIAAKNNINVLDRVKYTSSDMSEAMLASLFGVSEVLVSSAQLDSNPLGVVTIAVAQMWPDHAFFGYKPPRPSPKAASSGYIFMKNDAPVRRWREEEREAEAVEVKYKYQTKIVASLSGYLVTNVV